MPKIALLAQEQIGWAFTGAAWTSLKQKRVFITSKRKYKEIKSCLFLKFTQPMIFMFVRIQN